MWFLGITLVEEQLSGNDNNLKIRKNMKENKNAKNHAEEWHVCGLIIQVNPQKIAQVKTALLTIPHTEIPAEDEKGKLVVVMQSDDPQVLLNHMENSRNIDGVIDLSLIYHQQDDNVEQ